MTRKDLQRLAQWFSAYSVSFSSEDPEDQDNYRLKIEHTHRVRQNTVEIATGHADSPEKVTLAEAMALLHDVGRFPQYDRYRTFNDFGSVNHGKLGAQTLQDEDVLAVLDDADRELILYVVRFHNAVRLPRTDSNEALFFLKIIRDADKLDIYRVAMEQYAGGKRSDAATLGLPDSPGYTGPLLDALLDGGSVHLSDVSNLNDYRLMLLSWVYGLNFWASFRLLLQRNCITKVAAFLPRDDKLVKAVACVEEFARSKLQAH